jgi:hypothetical protein
MLCTSGTLLYIKLHKCFVQVERAWLRTIGHRTFHFVQLSRECSMIHQDSRTWMANFECSMGFRKYEWELGRGKKSFS